VKFHNVLEEVFGTGERVKVLRVLARYPKEFTSRELSGYCGVSVRGVIDILTLFERYGFIKSRRVGKSILWKINEDNYLTKSLVLPTFEVEGGLVDCLKRKISAMVGKSPVLKAVVYGSIASGDERPDSDIDLLLVVGEKGKWIQGLQNKLRGEILRLFGNALSILVCTPSEYKKMSRGLKREIEKGIAVFGG
jgi:predicted nucleotidyltransferase